METMDEPAAGLNPHTVSRYLHTCIKNQDEAAIIQYLEENPLDVARVNIQGSNNILMMACAYGNARLVQILLDRGYSDRSVYQTIPAINGNDGEGLENDADQEDQGQDQDQEEPQPQPEPQVAQLADLINITNNQGWSALMFVAAASCSSMSKVSSIHDYTDIMKMLLERNANIEMVCLEDGNSALMLAAKNGHAELVKLLAERGANVRARNKLGFTLLIMAVINRKKNVVEFLVNNLAAEDLGVDAVDNEQWTALMWGAFVGVEEEIIQLLLDAGCNPSLVDETGKTAKELAEENHKSHIVSVMNQRERSRST